MSTIQPLADWVVAQAEEAVTKTASGLYLPDKAAEKPKVAKVIAVGPGKPTQDGKGMIQPYVSVGQRIIYKSDYENTDIEIEGKKYVLIPEKNIVATIK